MTTNCSTGKLCFNSLQIKSRVFSKNMLPPLYLVGSKTILERPTMLYALWAMGGTYWTKETETSGKSDGSKQI